MGKELMSVKSIFFLLSIYGIASAETRTYLVKRAEHFPQDRFIYEISPQEYRNFIDIGKKNINAAGGQPFRMTSYELNYSGKYAIWQVTYNDAEEKNRMDSMTNKNYIVLLSSVDVVVAYDERIGGHKQEVEYHKASELPVDFYEVAASTP